MDRYLIYIDAAVDVDFKYIRENDIRFIRMNYTIGGEECVLTGEETEEDVAAFYRRMREGEIASTSQITPYEYEEAFGPELEKGHHILYLSLSSGLSNTYDSALLAREELKDKYPGTEIECVDTLSGTGGMGILLLRAIRNRDAGMSLTDNADDLRSVASHVCHWFTVDDLKYLKQGGRISPATAFVGGMLDIKPVLKVQTDGTLATVNKQRGVSKSLKQILAYYEKSRDDAMGNDVFVGHCDVPDRAQFLKEKILEINPDANIMLTSISLIIGAHVGPGMTVITHYGNRNGDQV